MALPTAEQITDQYLYGAERAPVEKVSENLVRDAGDVSMFTVTTVEYMSGPGRFVTPGMIDYVKWFMEPDLSLASRMLQRGRSYSKSELFTLFGVTGDISHRIAYIDQSLYNDGADDFLERVYIWNATAFQVQDGAAFVIDADGTRHIDNFALRPYSQPSNPENFNFESGSIVGTVANVYLEPRIDPSRIGRRVNFNFAGDMPTATLTRTSYDRLTRSTIAPDRISNAAYLFLNRETLVQRLWDSGGTMFLDSNGRPILYGTVNADRVQAEDVRKMPTLLPYAANGVVLISAGGDDKLIGGLYSDRLIGGVGDDVLVGNARDDTLEGGEDSDTLYGDSENENDSTSQGNDFLYGGAGSDKLYGGAGVDVLRGEADNDTLDGNGGNDYLLGGKGRDTYKYDGKTGGLDYILDEREGSACLGSIEYDKQTLTGGKRKGKSQYVWKSSNGYTFETNGDPDGKEVTLAITGGKGGKLKVIGFKNHDLGIDLKDDDDTPPRQPRKFPQTACPAGAAGQQQRQHPTARPAAA